MADSRRKHTDDSVHAGFDVKYTMDDTNRLVRAEEGTLSNYLGASHVVGTDYAAADVFWKIYKNPSDWDLDNFNRVKRSCWTRDITARDCEETLVARQHYLASLIDK